MERGKSQPRRCAIYTRKSSEEGLEQDFNSLHAQREACEAFIKSQHGEGWRLIKAAYDDGGFSGGTMERPALQRLLADIRERVIDVIVVYKWIGSPAPWPTSPRWSSCSTRTRCRLLRSPSSSIRPARWAA